MSNVEDIKERICSALDLLNRETALQIISEILDDYSLYTASKIVKSDKDVDLNKLLFEESFYSEGNEEAGFIKLTTLLNAVEEVVNCDDYIDGDITFEYFVRPETDEENEENGHPTGVEWWTQNENVNINDLYIQFKGN